MRRTRMLVWVDPHDCLPPHGLDDKSRRDMIKVHDLTMAFVLMGFDVKYPALVGYVVGGKIQLLSGTHRHMAALLAKIKLPVTLWLRSDVEATWGTDLWPTVIADIPVHVLENMPVEDGPKLSPYERVSFDEEKV